MNFFLFDVKSDCIEAHVGLISKIDIDRSIKIDNIDFWCFFGTRLVAPGAWAVGLTVFVVYSTV